MRNRIGFLSLLLSLGAMFILGNPEIGQGKVSQLAIWGDGEDLSPLIEDRFSSKENLLFSDEPTSALVEQVLRDEQNRISTEFKTPYQIRDRVEFWLRIYTEFTTQHMVIFDRYHPSLIYEVLDFRGLATKARNPIAYEILRNRRVTSTLNAYRKAFDRLSKNPRPKHASLIEKRILTVKRKLKHPHSFLELKSHLRAQTGQRDNVIKGIVAAQPFFPTMEKIFVSSHIPKELTRMTLVESSFQIEATSKVGAAGVWQFMPASAKEYMMVSSQHQIDERLSPLKSTVAAAKFLLRSYRHFKSWPLAITAYNHGYKAIQSRRKKNNSFKSISYLFTTCEKNSRGLGWASQNYYAEFLALLHADLYQDVFYGQAPNLSEKNIRFEPIQKPQSGISFALSHGIPLSLFKKLNPDILNIKMKLPRGFKVAVPSVSRTTADTNILFKKKSYQ